MRRSLRQHWRSLLASEHAWAESRAAGLIPVLGRYVRQLITSKGHALHIARLEHQKDGERIPEFAGSLRLVIPSALETILPPKEALALASGIQFTETLRDFEKRRGAAPSPGELLAEYPPQGEWERSIHITWSQVCASSGARRGPHPFQFALRSPFSQGEFVNRVSCFIEDSIDNLVNRLESPARVRHTKNLAAGEPASVAEVPARSGPPIKTNGDDDKSENRVALVDAFLERCNQQAKFPIIRKHIWLAAGHERPRQFQYWQSRSTKATQQDNTNFRRILSMSPSDFLAVLAKKNIH